MHVYLPQCMQPYLLCAHFQNARHMYVRVYVVSLTFHVCLFPHHPITLKQRSATATIVLLSYTAVSVHDGKG